MNLILSNGYPFPYPDNLTEAQQQALSEAAPSHRLVLQNVSAFEQKYTTTVEFDTLDAYHAAQRVTGWGGWSELVLEASTSAGDGYDYPAIVVGSVAYCSCHLVEATPLPLFYVRDHEGNHDLLARAASVNEALDYWRAAYGMVSEKPSYIGRVPLDTAAGAIDWDVVSGNALHYKDMEADDTPLDLLRACVAAKTALWDRLHDLEVKIAPNGEFSERANDKMVDLIDELAAGAGVEQPPITEAHLLRALEIATL